MDAPDCKSVCMRDCLRTWVCDTLFLVVLLALTYTLGDGIRTIDYQCNLECWNGEVGMEG